MDFCPTCGKRLIYKRRSKGFLYCPKCGYQSAPIEANFSMVRSGAVKASNFNVAILDREMIDLRTLPTVGAYCEKCGQSKAETWTVAVGSIGLSSITFYRCVSCGHTWREID